MPLAPLLFSPPFPPPRHDPAEFIRRSPATRGPDLASRLADPASLPRFAPLFKPSTFSFYSSYLLASTPPHPRLLPPFRRRFPCRANPLTPSRSRSRSPPEGTLASARRPLQLPPHRMASPARPAAASVSGAFGLSPDPKRCSFDQALRQKVTTARRRFARDLRVPPWLSRLGRWGELVF